ncbi:MAG: hypothetical protein D3926_06695 [Desulfobacteraceae bacterium]|nr:MAG: hypothetical protein D3926_06695 [Desulfobacteraceae bacterium]
MFQKNGPLLLILILLSILMTCSGAHAYTAQRLVIPYASIDAVKGWWSGVAIHNPTSNPIILGLKSYDASGTQINEHLCLEIPPQGTQTNTLQNFFSDPPAVSGRVSIYITSNGPLSDHFQATLFLGNNGNSNPGFAFQTYESRDIDQTSQWLCPVESPE